VASSREKLQKNDGAERSAERKVAERERSGGYINKLERGAAFSLLTLGSHALPISGFHFQLWYLFLVTYCILDVS